MASSSSHFAILNIPYTKISSFSFPPDLNLVPIRCALTPPCAHLYCHTGAYNIRTHQVCLASLAWAARAFLDLGGRHSLVPRVYSVTKEMVKHTHTKKSPVRLFCQDILRNVTTKCIFLKIKYCLILAKKKLSMRLERL